MLTAMPSVQVISFTKPMKTGANKPWLTMCRVNSDKRDEYVVKIHGILQRNIVKEYTAAYLATCLGIKTPPAAIIEIPNMLTDSVRDQSLQQALKAKPNPHWGTRYLAGYNELTNHTMISDSVIEDKLYLFAFDMLIQNIDRTVNGIGKPNILVQGDEFVAIDHDKTFACTDPLARLNPSEPWELRGSNQASSHVFMGDIRKHAQDHNVSFSDFIGRLQSIPGTTIDSMFGRMPSSWRDNEYERHILEHLTKIRSNLPQFSRGLLEVFA